MLKLKIDINCDLGESFGALKIGNDAKVMPHITSANIACGFHSGDPMTIAQTVKLAKKHKVAVGAHPGFPDLVGFGRREMQLAPEEAENYTLYQVGAVYGFAKAEGLKLQHVKPHGAMYNMAAEDEMLSKAIVKASQKLDDELIVFAPPRSALAKIAAKAKLRVALEFFADRAYNPDGSLVSRRQKGAIVHDARKVVQRAVTLVKEGTVQTVDDTTLNIGKVHTICVHGDTSNAVKLAESLRKGLTRARVSVEPVGKFI
jgi:UPF0271 protein